MTPELILASLLWSMVQMSAVDIQHRLERLMVVGRVLYVAAHPDDENTQLLSYLTHARNTRTAYLSLTRGDGGQNLIGSEQSPLMGVIRTHELLEARKIDGAEQLFTRARDFGYSKRADEALEVWGHEATLADVVWAVRKLRPHVIITRFPEKGDTHGHHLASAILAREAFAAAADPARFPEQLDRARPWQATRLLYNVPNRFMPDEARPDDLVVDIGGFDPVSGLSHGEIAAASRSMHKSQGFGAERRFGPEPERFRHLDGARAENDLLDGVPLDWRSVAGGDGVASALEAAREGFRPDDPSRIAPDLARALRALESVEDRELARWAEREIAALLVGASGLLLEARAPRAAVVPGGELPVKVLALRRGQSPVTWHDLRIGDTPLEVGTAVEEHVRVERELTVKVPAAAALATFPWLAEPPGPGRYRGPGEPHEPLPPPSLAAALTLEIAGAVLSVTIPVRHHWVDRVEGELHRDVEVLPAISATPAARAALVPCPAGKTSPCETKLRVALVVREPGRLLVEAPAGFSVSPESLDVKSDREIELTITGEPGAAPGTLRLVTESGGRRWSLAERPLRHRHLPNRTVLLPAAIDLTTATLDVPAIRVGHIAGPGDEVAEGLRRVGFDVTDIDDDTLARGELDGFASILVGVRAFNTHEALRRHHARLFAFAERGGTVVVQYATKPRREPLDVPLLPYAMTLGRGRVTDQTAKVSLLVPEHPLLASPHRIDERDFAGWEQERGLYFGDEWDEEHVTPLFAMADPGEAEEKGSVLVAEHGRGRVIYVGLSLFRQIPAGVPGAYRLAANLLTPRGAAKADGDEPPPVLGKWQNFYLVVLVLLAVLIGSFYWLTRRYSS